MDEGLVLLEEFVLLCEQVAQELQQSGEETQAGRLRNAAQVLGEYLNRQPSGGWIKLPRTIGELTLTDDFRRSMNEMKLPESLPDNSSKIQPDSVYRTRNEMLVSFSSEQIQQGIRYDATNKHLKAIEKGRVAPRGNMGLVPSEVEGYDLKSKVLGKGGDRRFHGKIIDGVLHFPGYDTEH